MARKDPYDPEEGIIDLFDVVDDPEASPETEPRGDLHDGGTHAMPERPEAAGPEDPSGGEAERVMSRYPFENSDDFLEEIEKTPLMTLMPPKEEASVPPEDPVWGGAEDGASAGVPEEPARDEPEEALIRAFEAEMAKAGAVVHEYGADAETVPGVPDESGTPSGPDAPVAPADAVEPDVAVGLPEVQEDSLTEPAERAYAEDLELLFGAVPVPDDPQAGPVPCAAEPAAAVEASASLPPEGDAAEEPETLRQADSAPEAPAEESPEPSAPLAPEEAAAEPVPEFPADDAKPFPFVPVVAPEAPANAAGLQAGPFCGHEMEERIIRLEEALSRLNERVAVLEQRADDADEQEPGVAALSGDIQSLLTEGNALCGQLKSLAETLASAPSGVQAEASGSAPLSPLAGMAEETACQPEAAASAPDGKGAGPSPEAGPEDAPEEDGPEDDGQDVLGLALESLERRIGLLESRPVLAPDAAGIAQDVLALVRVDMEKASEEQEASARTLEQLERRVQDLESRPLPQLILPDLPDTEAITADVMSRIQNELDSIAAEAAARVLREEIAGLMRK